MTQLLEKALTQIAKLSESEQDALATILLEEIESEERWSEAFARSQEKLAELAREALADHAAGRTDVIAGAISHIWFWVGPHGDYEKVLAKL
jgi:hypothetical protein